MTLLFEELDSQPSPLGEISLRRRRIPVLGDEPIYEVRLGDEFLMSSMFVDAEVALSTLGLKAVEGENLQVVVGGLGLGYTAEAALCDNRVGNLLVIDALDTVIRWHEEEKVPLGAILNADVRCEYVHGDFFVLATASEGERGFSPSEKHKQFDAILLDIDHSPTDFLHQGNRVFYSTKNLAAMARQLTPNGVFAMWSQDPPDEAFVELLRSVFKKVESHIVAFYNPFQNREATNSVYVCKSKLKLTGE